MRLSSDEEDSGYEEWVELVRAGKKAVVLLDGKEQPYCIMADEEAGVVEICVRDAEGHLVVRNEKIEHTKLEGKVEIKIEDV